MPSLPARVGATYAHVMHWPPVYLSSVALNTLPVTGPAARYHCGAPPARYEYTSTISVPFWKSSPKPEPDSLGFHQTPPTGTTGPAIRADANEPRNPVCRPAGK